MNGFYSGCLINYPYEDDASEKVRAWFASYKDKYNEDPTVLSEYGYQLADAVRHGCGESRPGPQSGHARQGARQPDRSGGFLRRRRAEVQAHQAPRLQPREAVPDPGRQVEVGVGVFDELLFTFRVPAHPLIRSTAQSRHPAAKTEFDGHPAAACITCGAAPRCGSINHPTI